MHVILCTVIKCILIHLLCSFNVAELRWALIREPAFPLL